VGHEVAPDCPGLPRLRDRPRCTFSPSPNQTYETTNTRTRSYCSERRIADGMHLAARPSALLEASAFPVTVLRKDDPYA
jgi:hypothetical protein